MNTAFSCMYQPRHSSWIWQQCGDWLYRATTPCFIPVCRVSDSVCRVYTWLFTNPAESYLLSQRCVRVSLQNKSMCLVGDNSLRICLCIIVVLWPQSLHDVGVLCLMRPVAGRFCAAVMQRLLPNLCLVFTQMWAGGVICNMTEICFVWREDSTLPCLLETNSRIGRQLFPEQTDLYTIRTFGVHDILSSTLCTFDLMSVKFTLLLLYVIIYIFMNQLLVYLLPTTENCTSTVFCSHLILEKTLIQRYVTSRWS